MATLSSLLADDPAVRLLQMSVVSGGAILLFLLFWTLRDVLERSKSFGFQLFALLIVTLLPVFGFLVYLLVRPSHTLQQREMMKLLRDIRRELGQRTAKPQHQQKKKDDSPRA